MSETRWVAKFKKNLACLAKITLEKQPGPGDFSTVKSRDIKLGKLGTSYAPGNLVNIGRNHSALYTSEQDALAFLAKGSDDIVAQVTQDAAMVADEYVLRISNLCVQAGLVWQMHAMAVREKRKNEQGD